MEKSLALGLALVATLARAETCVTLDDFSGSEVGGFPKGWISKYEKHMPEILEKKLYAVVADDKKKVLHAVYGTHTVTLMRQFKNNEWKLSDYPILKWRWKAVQLPAGGDESNLKKNDSAASVYVAWESNAIMKVKAIRYAWSSTRKVGEHFSRRFGNDQIIIKESGSERLNQWQEVQANVSEDYKKHMGEKKDPKDPIGIAITTDADGTKSTAEAFYADFRFCKP